MTNPSRFVSDSVTEFWKTAAKVLQRNNPRQLLRSTSLAGTEEEFKKLGWDQTRAPSSPEVLAYTLAYTDAELWKELQQDSVRLDALQMLWHAAALFESWNLSKAAYVFDTEVLETLSHSSLDQVDEYVFARLPHHAQYLHLEELGLHVDFSQHDVIDKDPIIGVFVGRVFRFPQVLDTEEEEQGRYELSVLLCTKNLPIPWNVNVPYDVPLEEVFVDDQFSIKPVIRKILPLMAYLCSEKPDIRLRSSRGGSKRRKKRKKDKPYKTPQIYETGFRLGKHLREQRKTLSKGGTVRTHVRRAHWHTFWVGPRKQPEKRRKVIKWVPPTIINGKAKDLKFTNYHVTKQTRLKTEERPNVE